LQPESVLELGTCVGVSAAYIGAALELNGHGRLVTLEGGTSLVQRSQHTLEELGLDGRVTVVHGPFGQTLEPTLQELGSVDLAFVDGHHQEEPTLRYTEQIEGHLTQQAVLAYDDIAWSAGMQSAWRQLCAAPGCAQSVDLGGMGLIVRGAPRSTSAHARIPYA
jgi:predicted O-methyltransferase YrrM